MKKILSIIMAAIILVLGLSTGAASAATTIKLNGKTATIGVNEAYTLKANTTSTRTVKWTSSNKAVATVNKNGRVTGKKTGQSTISASVGNVTASCKVTVRKAPGRISAKAVTVDVGGTAQIKTTLPKNTASKTLTYKSSNTKIARVNSNGRVTGVAAGSCNVTVRTYNGKSVSVKITVKGKTASGKMLVVYFSMPETTNPNNMTQEEENSVVVIDGKVLGNTQYVANIIQKNTDADIFRIEPKTPYPTDHATLVDLAKEEQNKNARPELAADVENIAQYDVIFLGYPNWWGDMPMVLYSFLESVDLSGKTIIPFNTHGGSGFSNTINTIARLQPNATVEKNGFTVSRDSVASAENNVAAWLRKLGIIE